MTYLNFLVLSKFAPNTEGIIPAANLIDAIKQHDGSEAYYCAFDLDKEFLKLEVDTGEVDSDGKPVYKYLNNDSDVVGMPTFKQYIGPARPAMGLVSFDFDSEDAQNSLDDVRKFVKWLDVEKYYVAFSGSKGFHVSIPFEYFSLSVNADLPKVLRDLAHELKKHFATIDTQVYNCNRKFRALNTLHPKTNLYKSIVLEGMKLSDIKKHCKTRHSDFYPDDISIKNPCVALIDLLQTVKQNATADLEKAGDRESQTNFEKYDKKLCIQKILDTQCPEGERNNTALILINDMFKTGKHKEQAFEVINVWAKQNGLPYTEVATIIENIYRGRAYYNHGCVDPIKAANCSGKCKIYGNLAPDKRPVVIDAPKYMVQEALKAKQPTEFDVITMLLTHESNGGKFVASSNRFEGGNLLCQKNELFSYSDGYWHHYKDEETSRLKNAIQLCYDYKAGHSKIDSTYREFLDWVPTIPKQFDFFVPNPFAINFTNGTLHLVKDLDGKFTYDFREHNKKDYLTNQIPLAFEPTLEGRNDELHIMLDRIFEGDEDKQDKINAIAEMFGAALLPAFPRLFLLCGKASSGKSTLCLLISKLLKQENMCAIEPHKFYGFHMAGMVGKLVNMVTDIDPQQTIKASVVKQIEDRVLLNIERKNKDDLIAPLPSIHIFGANDMPVNLDGASGAHDRRWTIVQFNNAITGTIKDYASYVYDKNPQGVLNFAIKGLMSLINNQGYFTRFKSSNEAMTEWQVAEEPVDLFFRELNSDEGCYIQTRDFTGQIIMSKDNKIARPKLWFYFSEWLRFTNRYHFKINSRGFYKRCKELGYEFKPINGTFYMKGYVVRLESLEQEINNEAPRHSKSGPKTCKMP